MDIAFYSLLTALAILAALMHRGHSREVVALETQHRARVKRSAEAAVMKAKQQKVEERILDASRRPLEFSRIKNIASADYQEWMQCQGVVYCSVCTDAGKPCHHTVISGQSLSYTDWLRLHRKKLVCSFHGGGPVPRD